MFQNPSGGEQIEAPRVFRNIDPSNTRGDVGDKTTRRWTERRTCRKPTGSQAEAVVEAERPNFRSWPGPEVRERQLLREPLRTAASRRLIRRRKHLQSTRSS